jgi:ABC-type Zn uptake system ZnuABC Zn-binding protein ZnuA
VATLLATACGGDTSSPAAGDGGALSGATTVAPITSIAAQIGGDRVKITGIVPEGTNSHTFEPKPSVAELLSTVDVLFINGMKLEDPTRKLAEANLKHGAEIVEVGTRSIPPSRYAYDFSFPRSRGKPNPHLWTDPRYALKYAGSSATCSSGAIPRTRATSGSTTTRFATLVRRFDAAMRASFATIPRPQRKLLTYHDAYAYFARDYGWDVIGAIQVSDFEAPTPKEVVADELHRSRAVARDLRRLRREHGSFDAALFGSILGVATQDVIAIAIVCLLAGTLVFLRYRALLFTTFDPEVAEVSGVNTARMDALLMCSPARSSPR